MWKHLMLMPLIAGVVLGVMGIYFLKPEVMVVYKYPTPDNAGKLTYRDKNSVCYQYSSKEVSCDSNEATLKTYPLN